MHNDYGPVERATAAPGELRNPDPETRTVSIGDTLPAGRWRIVEVCGDTILLERIR